MNVASLENCKKLYELSGWDDQFGWYTQNLPPSDPKVMWDIADSDTNRYVDCPAYDLGYLLRKLPNPTNGGELSLTKVFTGYGAVFQLEGYRHKIRVFADTPEDATCLLAIKLFEQGILTNSERGE